MTCRGWAARFDPQPGRIGTVRELIAFWRRFPATRGDGRDHRHVVPGGFQLLGQAYTANPPADK